VLLREDLQERLRVAYAQRVVDDVDPGEAVMLACDLLVEGADNDATVQLAIQSPRSLAAHQAAHLLERMLQQTGVAAPEPAVAARTVALDLCRRLVDGRLAPEPAAHRLLGAVAQTDCADGVARLLPMLDRLEYDLGGTADDAFRSSLLELARDLAARLTESPPPPPATHGALPRRRRS
jgi:hypothetical protein